MIVIFPIRQVLRMEETIDLLKLFKYFLKRAWIIAICAVIGFGGLYYKTEYMQKNMYTAQATLYVYNANPNAVNYQYTNTGDLQTAAKLVDTYKVVICSNSVMNRVVERLGNRIPKEQIVKSLQFGTVKDTGFMQVTATCADPQMAADICNAIADIAPTEIVRVVSAGSVQVVDYAELPTKPNSKQGMKMGLMGAAAGIALSGGILLLLFFMNNRLNESAELSETYGIPLLSVITKVPQEEEKDHFLISQETDIRRLSEYSKLRLNIRTALKEDMKTVLVCSAIPNECKSTTAANLAISSAMTGKKVLLIDADLRKPAQATFFAIDKETRGLSDVLTGAIEPAEAIVNNVRPNLDLIVSGTIPDNASELLDSEQMRDFLKLTQIANGYELIIIDLPPVNIVPDALALARMDCGMLFITRAGFSDHREIERAVNAAKFAEIEILGMVMTCAVKDNEKGYAYKYDYDYRGNKRKKKEAKVRE